MTNDKIKSIVVHEVQTSGTFDAYFSRIKQFKIKPNEDAYKVLEQLIGGNWERDPTPQQPVDPLVPNDRLLDISVEKGRHLYAIYLNAGKKPGSGYDHGQSLFFHDTRPLESFGCNGTIMEPIIEDPRQHAPAAGEPRWASFVLEHQRVFLPANGRPGLPLKRSGPIRLPFYFNLLDPDGNLPWVSMPYKRNTPQLEELPNHGGAHPPIGSFLMLPSDP
ncbi:hypothetical protein [Aurantiacibacter gangjinensis]|uniref:hypothetical protein n=1 Tax=Aurantiacibacter gangjinensis TaxID=502682 RepID=UPI0009038106|nr:hypothetical protein [Aurantiacibacter gangjinensis]